MIIASMIICLTALVFGGWFRVEGTPLHSGPSTNVNLTTTVLNSTVFNITGQLLHGEEDVSDVDFQKSVHLSVALAGMVLLLCFELHIRQQGYKLSRAWFKSTDDWMWIGMGVVSIVWTSTIFVSAWLWEENDSNPCRQDFRSAHCAGRLAFAPWILVGVFLWWLLRAFGHVCWRSWNRKHSPNKDSFVGPNRSLDHHHHTERKNRGRLARFRTTKVWYNFFEPLLVFILISGPVGWTTAGAFRSHLYTLGFLSAAALVFLGYALLDFKYHLILPHHYAMDDIRCALLTPLEKGIVYVLPSRGYGFDAVYCPRLESEQAVLEPARPWCEPLDIIKDDHNNKWTIGKCRAALRKVILARTQQVECDKKITTDLAYWLYWYRRDAKPTPRDTTVPTAPNNQTPPPKAVEPEEGPKTKLLEQITGKVLNLKWQERVLILLYRLRYHLSEQAALEKFADRRFPTLPSRGCNQRFHGDLATDDLAHKGSVNDTIATTKTPTPEERDFLPLLGRDVVMALVQWEYLVFEWRWTLLPDMRSQIWRLRAPTYSGPGFTDQLPLPDPGPDGPTMGAAMGKKGLLEAAGEVYRLLEGGNPATYKDKCQGKAVSEPKDLKAAVEEGRAEVDRVLGSMKERAGHLFRESVARPFDGCESDFTLDDYAGQVWDKCWAECYSTFGALYLWLTVWYIDMGNRGFHTMPLVPAGPAADWEFDGADYMSVWRMHWRHTWHVAIICQLVIMLPTIISTFFAIITLA